MGHISASSPPHLAVWTLLMTMDILLEDAGSQKVHERKLRESDTAGFSRCIV